jgi:hypothetical protein
MVLWSRKIELWVLNLNKKEKKRNNSLILKGNHIIFLAKRRLYGLNQRVKEYIWARIGTRQEELLESANGCFY